MMKGKNQSRRRLLIKIRSPRYVPNWILKNKVSQKSIRQKIWDLKKSNNSKMRKFRKMIQQLIQKIKILLNPMPTMRVSINNQTNQAMPNVVKKYKKKKKRRKKSKIQSLMICQKREKKRNKQHLIKDSHHWEPNQKERQNPHRFTKYFSHSRLIIKELKSRMRKRGK